MVTRRGLRLPASGVWPTASGIKPAWWQPVGTPGVRSRAGKTVPSPRRDGTATADARHRGHWAAIDGGCKQKDKRLANGRVCHQLTCDRLARRTIHAVPPRLPRCRAVFPVGARGRCRCTDTLGASSSMRFVMGAPAAIRARLQPSTAGHRPSTFSLQPRMVTRRGVRLPASGVWPTASGFRHRATRAKKGKRPPTACP